MDQTFFDLKSTHNPHRYFLPLEDKLCVGPPGQMFMYGGIGLASSIAALQRTCNRPVVWATAQYLSYARPGSVVDLDVWVPVEGRHTTQARVIAHVGDKEILTVNAALGERPSDLSHVWPVAPDMPPPDECEPARLWPEQGSNLNSRMDIRVAPGGRFGAGPRTGKVSEDGRMVVWIRTFEDAPIDASMLAVFADYVPSGVGAALGRMGGGNSLDNTLRIIRIVPTRWVMVDIRISAVHGGFAHGQGYLFAETGELMAIASQSVILRMLDEKKP